MNYGLLVKPGVSFAVIAPAGFRLLSALDTTARRLKLTLTITCGCDSHPPDDPHSTGEAYDVRTHDLSGADKRRLMKALMDELMTDTLDTPTPVSGGFGTRQFWGWIEHLGTPTEHLHVQRRNFTTYPIVPPGASLAA